MRIASRTQADAQLAALQAADARVSDLQAQLSSQRRIQRPSDDPAGAAAALALRGQARLNDQYGSNAADGLSWLSTADTTLSGVVTSVGRARDLMLQGLNAGALSPDAATALATEVDSIRAGLITQANAALGGRPIFGGTTTQPAAYAPDGSYLGDAGSVERAVGPNTTVAVAATGPQVFGSGDSSLFAVLGDVSAALRSGDTTTLRGDLSRLDAAVGRISTVQASLGATYQRVDAAQTSQAADAISLSSRLSDLQDVDFADVAIHLSTAQAAYQASLQSTATIRQQSLLDYLR